MIFLSLLEQSFLDINHPGFQAYFLRCQGKRMCIFHGKSEPRYFRSIRHRHNHNMSHSPPGDNPCCHRHTPSPQGGTPYRRNIPYRSGILRFPYKHIPLPLSKPHYRYTAAPQQGFSLNRRQSLHNRPAENRCRTYPSSWGIHFRHRSIHPWKPIPFCPWRHI